MSGILDPFTNFSHCKINFSRCRMLIAKYPSGLQISLNLSRLKISTGAFSQTPKGFNAKLERGVQTKYISSTQCFYMRLPPKFLCICSCMCIIIIIIIVMTSSSSTFVADDASYHHAILLLTSWCVLTWLCRLAPLFLASFILSRRVPRLSRHKTTTVRRTN